MLYTVKEIAALVAMTEHTIRFYADKGLVPNVKRDKNNNRLFDDESVNWLTGVKCLRECGMSIEAIKSYCDLCLEGDATIEKRYKIILEQKTAAETQLKEAKKRVRYLQKKTEHYLDTMNHQVPDVMNPGKWPVKSVV